MQSLTRAIDEYLVEKAREKDRRKREKKGKADVILFSPYLIGKCSRHAAYKLLGYPDEPDARTLKIAENGDAMHERYQRLLSSMGYLIYPEYKIKDEELHVYGRTDGLMVINDELVLLELKSCGIYDFQQMASTGQPRSDYADQLMLYMHLTGVKKGIILVECIITERKGHIKMAPPREDEFYASDFLLEFHLKYNQEHADRVVRKVKRILELIEKGILPEREFSKDSFDCRYCPFHDYCWLGAELTEEEKALLVRPVVGDLEEESA